MASLRLRRFLALQCLHRSDTSAQSTPPVVGFLLGIWSDHNIFAELFVAAAAAVSQGRRLCFCWLVLHWSRSIHILRVDTLSVAKSS